MKIGYARVSTDDQELGLQIDALQEAKCDKIFQDKMSGTKKERPGLEQMLEFAREGDSIVIYRLDRLGRSMTDLIQLVGQLEARKIHLRSLSEDLDTTSSTGKLIFHIFGAIAEFERNLIRERTMAGLAAARKRGRLGGRPTKLDEQRIKEIRILFNDPEIAVNDIAKRYGVSRGTIYRALNLKTNKY